MDSNEIWPPPPDILTPVQIQKRQKFRPALLLLGIGANALACLPAMGMSFEEQGAQLYLEGNVYLVLDSIFWWIPIALISLCVGAPLAVRQMRLRRAADQDIFFELLGLFLCLTPYWAGNFLLQAVVKAKGIVNIA